MSPSRTSIPTMARGHRGWLVLEPFSFAEKRLDFPGWWKVYDPPMPSTPGKRDRHEAASTVGSSS